MLKGSGRAFKYTFVPYMKNVDFIQALVRNGVRNIYAFFLRINTAHPIQFSPVLVCLTWISPQSAGVAVCPPPPQVLLSVPHPCRCCCLPPPPPFSPVPHLEFTGGYEVFWDSSCISFTFADSLCSYYSHMHLFYRFQLITLIGIRLIVTIFNYSVILLNLNLVLRIKNGLEAI